MSDTLVINKKTLLLLLIQVGWKWYGKKAGQAFLISNLITSFFQQVVTV